MTQSTVPSNKTVAYAESIGLTAVPISTAIIVMQLCAYDRHVPLLISETGTGKTDVMKQLCRMHDMEPVLYPLAHCEASDITGPMMPSSDGVTFTHLPDGRMPFTGHPRGNRRAWILFDEVNRAEMTTLNAVFPAWNEYRIGPHKLGPNVCLAAAMNPPDGDYAVTSQFSSDPAMRRRTCQIVVNASSSEWFKWARDPATAEELSMPLIELEPYDANLGRPIHSSVREFLQANVDYWMDRPSRDAGKVFGCPATWHQCSATLYTLERLEIDTHNPRILIAVQTKLAGHVGMQAAKELWEYHTQHAASLNPMDMLLHFAEKGNASQSRVKRLLKEGDAGRVAGALNNMSLVWAENEKAGKITSEEVAPNLAAIFNIVPLDVGGQLLDSLVSADKETGPSAGGPTEASTGLVRLLHKQPDFKKFRDRRAAQLAEKKQRELKAREEAAAAAAAATNSE